jgi:hypothetical protein
MSSNSSTVEDRLARSMMIPLCGEFETVAPSRRIGDSYGTASMKWPLMP